jgi:hypothetical protein
MLGIVLELHYTVDSHPSSESQKAPSFFMHAKFKIRAANQKKQKRIHLIMIAV